MLTYINSEVRHYEMKPFVGDPKNESFFAVICLKIRFVPRCRIVHIRDGRSSCSAEPKTNVNNVQSVVKAKRLEWCIWSPLGRNLFAILWTRTENLTRLAWLTKSWIVIGKMQNISFLVLQGGEWQMRVNKLRITVIQIFLAVSTTEILCFC